ncbi:mycolic acid cyclopropane synthetase family protein [Lyngbya aestuarii BL J]|uniref:tRNA1(Val) (adenine(37)-N6)-methyltransferase n=1 Tax=Lyngbya aestuarii BL J TaxID=1348334 RepID=U7QAV4_9CYAN|nr:methyltransferase [Lyngbya aestuarii]ERT04175.1 mycolic acid cyclopropane synthetase family protein [Lyngbya aestuarii BL J]
MSRRSNPYFQFKQFTLFQDRCAMKVGTDGVLLGAWTDIKNTQTILDIGTGTGLVALMLAQRSTAQIDTVEIDKNSSIQAKENITQSPWKERIKIYHSSVQDYTKYCSKRYNLIVSNPPFFENAYKALKASRTVARHTDLLSPVDLLNVSQQLLDREGRLTVIYPTEAANRFLTLAEKSGFFCTQKLLVKPTPNRPTKRILMEFSQSQNNQPENTLTIETERHLYTPEFIDLVKDFYLKY